MWNYLECAPTFKESSRMEVNDIRRVSHPELVLRRHLKPSGLTATEQSQNLKVRSIRVSVIVNGQRAIAHDRAFRLARFVRSAPDFWPSFQDKYDLFFTNSEKEREIFILLQIDRKCRHCERLLG
jgi:antitoxin HigA-1